MEIATALNSKSYFEMWRSANGSERAGIYTHVKRTGLDSIISPVEYLNLTHIQLASCCAPACPPRLLTKCGQVSGAGRGCKVRKNKRDA